MMLAKVEQRQPSTKMATAIGKNQYWRRHLTLATAVTWAVSIAVLGASLLAGYYALTILYQNKLVDTWAIMFLELEQQGTQLSRKLLESRIVARPAGAASTDVLLQVLSNGRLKPISGSISNTLTTKDLGFDAPDDLDALADITIVEYAGDMFLLSWSRDSDAKTVRLRKIDSQLFQAELAQKANLEGPLYLVTKEGRLVYSNDKDIGAVNFAARSLVQKFIASPLAQGQMEFEGSKGEPSYGFFREIPGSNIIMFAEVEKAQALSSVITIIWRFLAVLVAILLGIVAILQIPLAKLTGPLKELAALATKIGQGDLSAKMVSTGFGEVSLVSSAFNTMADNLVARDASIQTLMREQVEKFRLESELKVARSIQENLLPTAPLASGSGLEVSARYIPATECAGDWYDYHFNPSLSETIVAIADVSGHGAGSALFTAIIAGLFTQFKLGGESSKQWDPADFMRQANSVIGQLGHGAFHATMLLVRHRPKTHELDIFYGGHNPPFVLYPQQNTELESRRLSAPSQILGDTKEFEPVQVTISFPRESSILLYTDGLTEARNRRGTMFGQKKAGKIFSSCRGKSSEEAAAELISTWGRHLEGQVPLDDTCVVILKAM